MKHSLLYILLLLCFNSLYAQESKNCNTYSSPEDTLKMFHFGRNEILDDILKITSINKARSNKKSDINFIEDNTSFHIPVKIWIYEDDGGGNTISMISDVYDMLDEINLQFSTLNTSISFYLKCEPEYIQSTQYNDLVSSEFDNLIGSYREPKAMNWHLVNRSSSNFVGRGQFPDGANNFSLAMTVGSLISDTEEKTAIHEVGHTLGLLHTHENIRSWNYWNGDADKCYQESVSRTRTQGIGCVSTIGKTKCGINGDALCDTNAAPNKENTSESIQVNPTTCTWTGTGTDKWGDTWNPPTTNYMSYLSDKLCRTSFSPKQIAVMQSSIVAYMATTNCVPMPHATCNPPGLQPDAMPWYNQDALLLTGNINSGEAETYYVADKVHLSSQSTSHTVKSGSNLFVQAQNQIILDKNFKSETNAPMMLQTGAITNCSLTYSGESGSGGGNARNAQEILANIDMEMVRGVVDILKSTPAGGSDLAQETTEENSSIEILYNQIVTAYPNPSKEVFNLNFQTKKETTVLLEIYDMQGKLWTQSKVLLETPGNQDISINICDLPTGLYSYILEIDGSLYNGKLIK